MVAGVPSDPQCPPLGTGTIRKPATQDERGAVCSVLAPEPCRPCSGLGVHLGCQDGWPRTTHLRAGAERPWSAHAPGWGLPCLRLHFRTHSGCLSLEQSDKKGRRERGQSVKKFPGNRPHLAAAQEPLNTAFDGGPGLRVPRAGQLDRHQSSAVEQAGSSPNGTGANICWQPLHQWCWVRSVTPEMLGPRGTGHVCGVPRSQRKVMLYLYLSMYVWLSRAAPTACAWRFPG